MLLMFLIRGELNDHLFGKERIIQFTVCVFHERLHELLFTWLSLVMSMMVSFCAVRFPTRCLG